MADKNTGEKKKELSEKQKEVLERNNFKNKTPAERSELGARGAAKTNQIKAEKIKRAESKEIIFNEFLGTIEQLRELWKSLKPKDRKDILLKLLPNDEQSFNLNGNVGTKTVFITASEHKETLKHIQDVINEQ